MDLSLLGMLCSAGGSSSDGACSPNLLLDGNIPTSREGGVYSYSEFTIDKDYSLFLISTRCNNSGVISIGYSVIIPINYVTEEEKEFSFTGYPKGTNFASRGYIKRSGNTFFVRGSSNACDYLTIYGM